MSKLSFFLLGAIISLSTAIYSCDKEEGDDNVPYSISGTTWIYSDVTGEAKNTFEFTDEQLVSFTQDWVDSGVNHSESTNGTYTYSHPSVSITVDSKEYAGTIVEETMNIGGFIYNKQ